MILTAAIAAITSGCAFIQRVDGGAPTTAEQMYPSGIDISPDGRWVVFAAGTPDDGSDQNQEIWRRDLQTGNVQRVSLDPFGGKPYGAFDPKVSANGDWVAYSAYEKQADNFAIHVFLTQVSTGTTTWITANTSGRTNESFVEAISANGGRVLFRSTAEGLSPHHPGNEDFWLYRFTRSTGAVHHVGQYPDGSLPDSSIDSAAMSQDGRYIAYTGICTCVRDLVAGTAEDLNEWMSSSIVDISISDNGRFVAGTGSVLVILSVPVFVVADREDRLVEYASVDSQGGVSTIDVGGEISGDGTRAIFRSSRNLTPDDTNNASDVYVRDLENQRTHRLTSTATFDDPTTYGSSIRTPAVALSGSGALAAFAMNGSGLTDDDGPDQNVFVRSTAFITVASAAPSSLPDGTTTVVTITGTGFRPDTQWGLSADDRSRWTVLSSATIDDDTATMTIKVTAGATPGPINIVAINPGNPWGPYNGAANWCLGCLTIT